MSQKEMAFALFSQGKRPGDGELKALGITAKTRYNYYQEFKKSKSDEAGAKFDDIEELKKERTRLAILSQIEELESKRSKLPEKIDSLEKRLDTLIDYLNSVLDGLQTISIKTFAMCEYHWLTDHKYEKDTFEKWEPYRDVYNAIDSINKAELMSDSFKKCKSR